MNLLAFQIWQTYYWRSHFINLVENLKVNNDNLQVHIDKDAHQQTRLIFNPKGLVFIKLFILCILNTLTFDTKCLHCNVETPIYLIDYKVIYMLLTSFHINDIKY
jgi:hypothetical protein